MQLVPAFWFSEHMQPRFAFGTCFCDYSKTCLNSHSQKDQKLVFKTKYCLMQVKSIAECSKGSILQYV